VNRYHDFSDATLEDFLLSAVAIGPAFESAGSAGVGRLILNATHDTREWARSNTNLGMILLFAPLIKASFGAVDVGEIRANLNKILRSLTVEDARLAYAAIRGAKPGGLGSVEQADVAQDPSITLFDAMLLARERDAIAREYVTDYAITFEIGFPALTASLSKDENMLSSIVQTYLRILGMVPDTLIARKKGMDAALLVSQMANAALDKGGPFTPEGRLALAEMDHALRDDQHMLNPGTSADLTAASIFLALFSRKS
jgi:triphosphoribosyl-dephospho-CoA synthase